MFIAKVYGNNPKVIEANYLLSVNAQSSAPVIDLTQQKLFKNIAESYAKIKCVRGRGCPVDTSA